MNSLYKSLPIILILSYAPLSFPDATTQPISTKIIDKKISENKNQINQMSGYIQNLQKKLVTEEKKWISNDTTTINLEIENYTNQINNLENENEVLQREKKLIQKNIQASYKSKVNPVTQVLNYSSGCDDNGCGSYAWFIQDVKRCIYEFIDLETGDVRNTLNLNEMDPRDIKMGTRSKTYSNVTSYIESYGRQNYRIFQDNPETQEWSVVEYRGTPIFTSFSKLDSGRLIRGWSLIYSKYCSGTKKSF